MCIAILKKQEATVPKEQLKESFISNPDGSGYMFANNGNLTIKKGFFKFDEFYDNYSRDMKKFNNPIAIIHFRITTHGLTNRTNCHPFLIDDSIGFAHNGIIDFVSDHKKKSDTIMFKREILQQLPDNFINNDIIIRLIEESIGNSKLVFLNRKGEFRIANEHKGHWSDDSDIWYSNNSYCEIQVNHWNTKYYDMYKDYDVLNITNKKKKKVNKGNKVERTSCRTCSANLFTIAERQVGHCYTCQQEYQDTSSRI